MEYQAISQKSSFILFRSMVYYRLLCDKKIQNILGYYCVTRIKLRKYYLFPLVLYYKSFRTATRSPKYNFDFSFI
jgi:hypothetical protein